MTTRSSHDILTITLNPALDYATSVARIVADQKLYCDPPRIDPGGGGVNVARAICKLGGRATAFVVAGGPTGERLQDLLRAEAIPLSVFPVAAETRFSFAVTDAQTGSQHRYSLPGAPIAARDRGRILDAIAKTVPRDGLVVLSGGMPPGLPDDFPQRIQHEIASSTPRLVVDTSKAPLQRLIDTPVAPLFLLRVDQKEAAQAARHAMASLDDSLNFAASLVARGVARHVVTGRGAEGSLMVTPERRFVCRAPQVPIRSKVGAGDAFVGAMVLALSRGAPPEQALRRGVAAASATVGTDGTALCDRESADMLLERCEITEV